KFLPLSILLKPNIFSFNARAEKTGISQAAFLCAIDDCRIALIYQLNDISWAFALIFPINPRRIDR
ncbi:hypothetical protein, partial [Serratia surfactantfaciens]|uniref:hypothetical protein n=1 Tax=Serratia surfactantfaciens TaxID=2741499 RepID=UPI001B3CA468